MEVTIKIMPEGKEVILLYMDHNPVNKIGEKSVVRASDVKFNNEDGLWYVHEVIPGNNKVRHSKGFHLREQAINYEIQLLEKHLDGDAKHILELFEELGSA